jgi:predicted transcriptional regulator
MKNRQKDEIIRDVLSCINVFGGVDGCTISQIMFRAYLSHPQAKSYLGMLIKGRFVYYDIIGRKYIDTPQGLEFLKEANNMATMLNVSTIRRSYSNKQLTSAHYF